LLTTSPLKKSAAPAPPGRKASLGLSCILRAVAVLGLVAHAHLPATALQVFVAEGGRISGFLETSTDTTIFTDAVWSVRGEAQSGEAAAGLVLGSNPIRYQPVVPTLRIGQGLDALEMQLLNSDPFRWTVYSLLLITPGVSVNGFGRLDLSNPSFIPDGFPDAFAVALPGGFNDLQAPLNLRGRSDARAAATLTDLGLLTISASSQGPGSFLVHAPSPAGVAGLAAAFRWSRRLRRRLGRSLTGAATKGEASAAR
jgi:hypothetical protein